MVAVSKWTSREVRALLEATRCTHDELAHDLGVSERIIDRWVSPAEVVVPRPVNQRALDTVLARADSDAVRRFIQLTVGLPSIVYEGDEEPAEERTPRTDASTAVPATRDVTKSRSGTASGASVVTGGPARESLLPITAHAYSAAEHSPHRSEDVSTQPGALLLGDTRYRERTLIMSAANESAAFAQRAGQTNVHPSSLEQIEADIDRISRDYLTQPIVPLVGEMRYVRDMTFAALEGHQYPSQTRQLYLFAAQLCGLLASASSDLAFYDAAKTQARTALLCTQLAEEPATGSWVMAIQSLIAFWDGRPTEAVDRAIAGQVLASEPTDLLRLASLEARARARLGDLPGTREAIGRGQQILESTDAVRHTTIFDFPAANALRCFGSAYLWLGAHEAAESALEQALRLFEADTRESESSDSEPASYAHLAVTRIDLALAHLGRGSIDAAEEVLRPVLALSPERRLSGIVRRSNDLHIALAAPRYAEARSARSLTSDIEAFCSVNARHALAEGGE